jgi:RNA recognition motif-containing protein
MSIDGEGSDRSVFVGGISIKATEEGLQQFFESNFGEVDSSKIIYDRTTGRSKGYGFVTFRENDTAERVRNCSGLVFLGKVLNIGNAYRRQPVRPSSSSYSSNQPIETSAGAPSAEFGGGYGGFPPGGNYPYFPNYWPPMFSPIPPSAGDGALAGQQTLSPEQSPLYQQAQMQAIMQAQMVMWQQMQQNPAAMQQMMAQLQAMSLGGMSATPHYSQQPIPPKASPSPPLSSSSMTSSTASTSSSSSSSTQSSPSSPSFPPSSDSKQKSSIGNTDD